MKDEFSIAEARWRRENGEAYKFDYPLNGESVVIDLGGYKGDFAAEIYEQYGCRIYVFEPVEKFYDECVRRFRGNEKIRCFNYGISSESGTFYISNEGDGSSLIKGGALRKGEQVTTRKFCDEYSRLSLSQIDLMKINIEGAEFLLLPHIISSGLMSKIDNLLVQFHTFYPDAKLLRGQIREQLANTHAEHWNYPFVWESWRRRD